MRWLVAALLVAGCSGAPGDGGVPDFAVPPDDGGRDLATPPNADLAAPSGADLAGAPGACPCGYGQRCVGGACVAVDDLEITLGQQARQIIDGGYSWQALPYVSACFAHPASVSSTPVATSGGCSVYAIDLTVDAGSGSSPLYAGSAGTITVTGGTRTVTLTPGGVNGCYASDLPSGSSALFSDGQQLTVSGTGGSDFPAFTASVTAPATVTVTSTQIQRGQPLALSWGGSEAGGRATADVVVYDAAFKHVTQLICVVDDTGGYTVPASLTQYFPADSSTSWISVSRSHLTHQEPAAPAVAIDVEAIVFDTRDVSYTP